jgi:diguanylate cyclase (GGDEF)-like protein/PAS domain S-box-containing protein
LFGLPRKDLHQHRLAEFVTEDDKGLWQRTFSSLKNLAGGEELGVDIKFINTKGTEFIASLNCLRMDDDDDQPILRITLIDVTQLKDAEEKLQQSEAYLRTIIDNEPECIKVIDARGNLKQMNPAGLAMLEVETLEQATSIPLLDYIAPEYRSAFADLHKRVIAGESMQLEYEMIGNKGCRRWVDTHAVPFQYQSKKMILAVTRDFTERKIAENELRISATAFESQEGIVIADANHNIVRVNHAFNNITGYSSDEVIGKNPRLLSSGLQTPEFYAALWNRVDQTGSWQGEIWNKRKNGELYLEYLTITSVKNEAGILTNYVATLSDVTQNKLAAAEIEKLAFYDALTGLPNRRLMVDRLSQALASSARTGNRGAVVFLDLDHFKSLNDTLGHHVGDKLLQQVGSRLKSCVREGDTVARLGGDEYVVLLEKLSEKEIEAARQVEIIANNILTTLNHPHHLEEHEYLSTASIGISIFYDHNQPVEELLKQADIAMYQAKKAGRNTLRYFDPKMQDVIQERVSLEGDLRKALEKRQLTLYYQVQVDFLHHPIGVEALIRWKHPERGLVPPFEFIPIAEETGLIIPIGQWVLETACAQIKAWDKHEQTRKLTISINVSSKQFRQPDFAIQVHKTLERYAINPALLKLELTESLLLDNIEDTINTMNVLKNNGVLFSLDDFGTGYSSLQYLKRLPLYQLKIDQSFVRDIAVDSNDLAIIRTIIAMAHILDLSVIAEGVETEKQQQLLLSIGCTNYQGYLFGKPMAIAPFEKALNKI